MTIKIRKSGDRAYFDHGWLKTYHTFSFARYYDPQFMGFRALRVLNEDRVSPGVGFPLHAHQDMEIISIVLEGGLAHQDDMGNGSILHVGDVQLMSAGRGVSHTESNASDKEEVHFIQIWILPDTNKLVPSYQERHFPDEAKHNKWCLIVSKDGRNNSLMIHQDVSIYMAHLDQGIALEQNLAKNRYGWIQILKGQVVVDSEILEAGDGASISHTAHIDMRTQEPSQILFFDLG
jgi:quercetin 2,3-dioxygenase